MADVYAKRRNARKKLRQTIAQSYKLQIQHLIARDTSLDLNGETKQGKHIKQLIIIKNQHSLYAEIKHHFNQTSKSSLSKI